VEVKLSTLADPLTSRAEVGEEVPIPSLLLVLSQKRFEVSNSS